MRDHEAMVQPQPITVAWRHGLSIVNLRGSSDDAAFVAGVSQALGMAVSLRPCSTQAFGQNVHSADGVDRSLLIGAVERVVWAGPDEWFVVAAAGCAGAVEQAVRTSLAGMHHAITDVSSGYTVLHLSGQPVCEVLAQGCPLDLHPRAFGVGRSAGSHFFKASMLLWQTDAAPHFELLVRRSFTGYVQLMLQRCTLECGLAIKS